MVEILACVIIMVNQNRSSPRPDTVENVPGRQRLQEPAPEAPASKMLLSRAASEQAGPGSGQNTVTRGSLAAGRLANVNLILSRKFLLGIVGTRTM